ncbi:MAG TPA: tRNA (guanosine(37)-N1)-methyltransferase TrmD [Acidobacteriota bacterium]
MRFDIVTIFPDLFAGPLSAGLLGKAVTDGLVQVRIHDLRQFTHDRHRTVDDRPYGGGPGMVLKPEPLFEAVERLQAPEPRPAPVVLLTPSGRLYRQEVAKRYAAAGRLILLCGRYEGVDERVHQHLADEELSIGDYVLGGGELAALVVVESVARLVPGVVGDPESLEDCFSAGLLDYPQYTRPEAYRGWKVPEVLLSGDHARIERWRREQRSERTRTRRPDLLVSRPDGGAPSSTFVTGE